MGIVVRYFARLREIRGAPQEEMELSAPMSVGALYADIFSAQAGALIPVMYAVNQAYVAADHLLKDGDEVAFIPPLGGG